MIDIKNVKFNLVDSADPKYVEVLATYSYNGKLEHHYIFLNKKKNYTKADYLKEAKAVFDEDNKHNLLGKGGKAFSTHRGLVIATTVLAACTLALGGFLTYQYLKPGDNPYTPGTPVEVKVDIPDLPTGYEVKLSNLEAKVSEKYETNITLSYSPTNEDTHYRLPDALDKVTSYKTDLTKEQYTYTYKSENEASLSIEGNYVFGPVAIKLTLVEAPGPAPVIDYKILLSDKSEGVSLPSGQTISANEIPSFDVKININEGYKEPIKVRYINIGKTQYEYPTDYSVISTKEGYHITFNKPCLIDGNITLTVSAQKVVTGTRKISIPSGYGLYKDDACLTEYTPEELAAVNAAEDFIAYVKPKVALLIGDSLSLGVDVTKGKSTDPLTFGEDYKYRFVAEDVAQITIPSGEGDINISPRITSAKAEFIYHAKPGAEDILTLYFNKGDAQYNIAATIDWGDESPLESFDEEIGTMIYHIYHNNQSFDKDYLIRILPNEESANPVPKEIGFDTTNYGMFDDEPTRFASGLKNIKGAHLTKHFTGITSTGFNCTSIDSLYISSNLDVYDYPSYNLMFCNNLEAFYVDPMNEIYSTNNDHTMLLRSDGADGKTVVSVANIERLNFDTSITSLALGACVGRNRVTSMSFSKNFRSMSSGHIPAIASCPNLTCISVSSENTAFIPDSENTPINALIKVDETANGALYTFYTTIANTSVELLNQCNELRVMPFAFSSLNSYAGDILINKPKKVAFYYFGFYNSPVTSITLEGNSFEVGRGDIFSGAVFYKCHNLKSIILDSFPKEGKSGGYYFDGLIQECPNLTKLDITTPIKELVNRAVYAVNNTLYQYIENDGGMELIATSSVTEVLDEVNVGGTTQPVVSFNDYVFKGNNLKEIYIPNNLGLFGESSCLGAGITAPFRVGDDNPYYIADNSIPGQSILYGPALDPETEEPIGGNELYGCSLMGDNHTLVISDKINILYSIALDGCDALHEIKFTANDASQYNFIYGPFIGCNNLTTVDFTASKSGRAPTIGDEEISDFEVFIMFPFQKLVTIKVADEVTYKAFTDKEYPLSTYNIELVK